MMGDFLQELLSELQVTFRYYHWCSLGLEVPSQSILDSGKNIQRFTTPIQIQKKQDNTVHVSIILHLIKHGKQIVIN